MQAYKLTELATEDNYTDEAYLAANPDVAIAIKQGIHLSSARLHFDIFAATEGRCIRLPLSVIENAKKEKLLKIKPLLRKDIPYIEHNTLMFDFLNEATRHLYNISETDAVSSNAYDTRVENLIEKHKNGLILDCGAGQRDLYYENIVNLDIVPYDTTDIVAAGENLPFNDNSFDAVVSLSVLEHVKDPFLCAKELSRVLKPGGELICSVPFLQPYHAYPHHYFNMTTQGLSNLFEGHVHIDKIDVSVNELPIWSLTWILRNWANGLEGKTREDFLETKIGDLILTGDKYLDKPFVKELSEEKNKELAYATVLLAHK